VYEIVRQEGTSTDSMGYVDGALLVDLWTTSSCHGQSGLHGLRWSL
jgi:hypothetical protein